MPEINNMVIFFVYVFYQNCNYDIGENVLAGFGVNFPKTNPLYDSQAQKTPKFYLNKQFIYYQKKSVLESYNSQFSNAL